MIKSIILPCIFYIITFFYSVNAQGQWSLKTCIATALKRNISINQGILTSNTNRINLSQSKAALLPNLNLIDVQSLNSGYSLDPFTYQYTKQKISINSLSLNSYLTLFNGFLLINTIQQNKLTYAAGVLDVEKLKNDIMLNVLAGYMQVLMDYEGIDVAQQQVEATTTQVEQTQKFLEFGKVAELNLVQMQSQLATDKLTMLNAENQLLLDKLTLLQLMEEPMRNDFDIERQDLTELFPETPMPADELDKISENIMPQVKSASLKTNAAIYSLKMAESGLMPKLVLGGILKSGYSSLRSNITENSYYQQSTIGYVNNNPTVPVIGNVPVTVINSQKDPFLNQWRDNFGQVINLTLSLPIFNNLQFQSAVDIAKISVMNAKLNELQTKNDLRKSIETAYTNQVSAGKKLIATEEQMRLETKTYHDMAYKYTYGAMDVTDFLVEKNNFIKISLSLIQAKYDYVLKTKVVDFYSGKTLTF